MKNSEKISHLEALNVLGFDTDYEPSSDEVKRAFKNLARQNHPDTNPDGTNVHIFSKLVQARDLLIHEEKIYLLPMGIGELVAGTILTGFKTICGTCHGRGITDRNKCDSCDGKGGKNVMYDNLITQDVCNSCGGKGVVEKICPNCHSGYKIFTQKLNIPAGTRPDTTFVLDTGDIIQIIIKKEKKNFTIRDNDIYGVTLAPWTKMISGGEHIARDPNNSGIEIKIKPGTASGASIRVPNRGFKGLNGKKGDLIFKVYPIVPKQEDIIGAQLKLALMAFKKAGY